MEKALEILKEHLASLEAWAYRGEEILAEIEKTEEAIVELEALQEENKILKHNYDVQVEYNNTAYKNYTNMVNSLEQRLEEAMKPKTCKLCAYCEPFNSVCFNDKSPLCADFVNSEYGCIYWERKATT